jgi:hypothetical protein
MRYILYIEIKINRLGKNSVNTQHIIEIFHGELMPQQPQDAQKGCPARPQ